MEGATAGFAFASEWLRSIQLWLHLLNQAIISFRQQCFGATHSLFVNYFPKWNIETLF
jgi:O-succinylhomoserine sulfhydrylase